MDSWKRFTSAVGEARIIAVLGALVVAMAAIRIILWEGGNPLSALVATDLLIILPGLLLLYGGYWLPDEDLHPNVYSRIVARCLAGIAVMLGVVGLLALSTGLNRPVFTPMAGAALGSGAGFVIGLNEARALSRHTKRKKPDGKRNSARGNCARNGICESASSRQARSVYKQWRFSVADEGIDPDHHDQIFDVFERLHTSRDEVEAGVGGIGLALCERIVQRHGGDIWVESTPGEGSTFYFSLPGAKNSSQSPPLTPPLPSSKTQSVTKPCQ